MTMAQKTKSEPVVEAHDLKGHYEDGRVRLVVLKPGGNSMGAYILLKPIDPEKRVQTTVKGALVFLERNPPQGGPYAKIPRDLDFLAVISPYRPTALADCAHVLIPKPSWLEMDGTCTGLDGCEIAFRRKVIDTPAAIKSSRDTLAGLAARTNANLDYGSWDALRLKAEREGKADQ